MEFDLISDIHIDANEEHELEIRPYSETLVVAGDVSDDFYEYIRFLENIAERYVNVITVPGNHEFRTWHENVIEGYAFLTNHFFGSNVHVLTPHKIIEINKTKFVGSTGWYDFRAAEPAFSIDMCKKLWRDSMFESSQVNWGAYTPDVLASYEADALDKILEGIDQACVITHTLPHRDLTYSQPDPRSHGFIGTVVNSLMEPLVEKHANKISAWICGHTHKRFDRDFKNVRFVNNARGVVNSGESDNWQMQTIDLEQTDPWANL